MKKYKAYIKSKKTDTIQSVIVESISLIDKRKFILLSYITI